MEKPLFLKDPKGKQKPLWWLRREAGRWTKRQIREFENYLLDEKITDQGLWNLYLRHYKRYLREWTLPPEIYDVLANTKNDIRKWIDEAEGNCTDKYNFHMKYLASALRVLSLKEAQVIRGIYWDNYTERGLAKKLSMSGKSIGRHKKNALLKMKQFLSATKENYEITERFQEFMESLAS